MKSPDSRCCAAPTRGVAARTRGAARPRLAGRRGVPSASRSAGYRCSGHRGSRTLAQRVAAVVKKWSGRDGTPTPSEPSGHEHRRNAGDNAASAIERRGADPGASVVTETNVSPEFLENQTHVGLDADPPEVSSPISIGRSPTVTAVGPHPDHRPLPINQTLSPMPSSATTWAVARRGLTGSARDERHCSGHQCPESEVLCTDFGAQTTPGGVLDRLDMPDIQAIRGLANRRLDHRTRHRTSDSGH
jgi:hypothetical protein